MGTDLADDVIEGMAAKTGPPVEGRAVALSRPLIITGLIMATALSALDVTIISTALPTIVGVLGGLEFYPLVVAAFLLTATTTVPVYGKLSDMFGRKPIFLVGAGIFILGSALCGLAWDMPSLIAFRALQGLGAGSIVPVSLTLIGDLFDVEERARIQGVFGSVWGVSSIVGPLVGGAIVQFFDWRWAFFINVPVGILSMLLIFLYLREPAIHTRQRVDFGGAITLTVGMGLLLMALQSGSQGGWLSPVTLLFWAGAIALLALFIMYERRAPAPILSFDLLSRPVIAIPCLTGLLAGVVLIGYAAYVPLLVQGAWGGSPIEAGLIVAPMSLGWPIASATSGRLIKRVGYFPLVVTGMSLVGIGTLLLLAVGLVSDISLKAVITLVASAITGLGFGASTTTMLIALQVSVPWSERGVATASAQFFRNMGQAIGATVLGTILTLLLAPMLASERVRQAIATMPPDALKAGGDPALGPANALFDLDLRPTLAPDVVSALADALSTSLWWTFLAMLVIAVLGVLVASRFPRVVTPADSGAPAAPQVRPTSLE
ncbi:MAG: MFS transporter [Chloroflexota bacterium]|nr:MFS transporter [Chloroflexota bacterium]MDQ5866739.1 MFS transporter [Chloroflexota bacterium]